MKMKIKINNEIREVMNGASIADILTDIQQSGTATALNGNFIAKDARAKTILKEGDEVTIISAAYGG